MTVLRFRLHLKSSTKERLRTEEEQKDLKPYKGWKPTLILYELAQTLCLFQTIMFWCFWHTEIFEYYAKKEPQTERNVIMRKVNCYVSNIVPPLIMLIDFMVSKVYFRITHIIIHIPIFFVYWAIRQTTSSIVPVDPNGAVFPSEFFD